MTRDRAQLLYLQWLKANHPDVWRGAIAANPGQNLGWITAVVNAVVAAGSLVMAKKQAKKQEKLAKQQMQADSAALEAERRDAMKLALLEVNTKRAQAGLPPVDENGNLIGGAQAIAAAGKKAASFTPWILAGGGLILAIVLIRKR